MIDVIEYQIQQKTFCTTPLVSFMFNNTLYIFEEKYSLKNTLLNVLPYEQAS